MSIEARVEARLVFEEIVEMYGLRDKEHPVFKAHLIELFAGLLGPPAAAPASVFTMNEAQARMYGLEEIKYGMHKGSTYAQVYDTDPGYLDYIADEGLRLGAYLRARKSGINPKGSNKS